MTVPEAPAEGLETHAVEESLCSAAASDLGAQQGWEKSPAGALKFLLLSPWGYTGTHIWGATPLHVVLCGLCT